VRPRRNVGALRLMRRRRCWLTPAATANAPPVSAANGCGGGGGGGGGGLAADDEGAARLVARAAGRLLEVVALPVGSFAEGGGASKAAHMRLLLLLISRSARHAPAAAAAALCHLLGASSTPHSGGLPCHSTALAPLAALAAAAAVGWMRDTDTRHALTLALVAALAADPGGAAECAIATALGLALCRALPLADHSHPHDAPPYAAGAAWSAVRALEARMQRESSDDELRCDCVLALVRIGTAARARASRGCAAHHELLQGCARPLLRALRDGRLDYFGSELAQRTLQRWEADRPDGGLFV